MEKFRILRRSADEINRIQREFQKKTKLFQFKMYQDYFRKHFLL